MMQYLLGCLTKCYNTYHGVKLNAVIHTMIKSYFNTYHGDKLNAAILTWCLIKWCNTYNGVKLNVEILLIVLKLML